MNQDNEILQLKSRLTALEQLLSVYEQTTIKQANIYENVARELRAKNEELKNVSNRKHKKRTQLI